MRRWLLLLTVLDAASPKLIQVFVIWRHGDRAPDGLPYPKDPYNQTYWPRGWDQLTDEGIRQTYALGSWLRQRYTVDEPLLPQIFDRDTVLFRSSNEDRAVESAQAVAAGLFPIDQPVLPNLTWQPIPIFTSTYGVEDPLLRPSGVKCPLVKRLVKNDTDSLEREINTKYADLFRKLENYTGFSEITFKNVKKLNGIRMEMYHGLSQPAWVNETWNGTALLDHIKELKRINRLTNFNTKEKSRIKAGVLLNDWASHMETSSRGFVQKKALLYSAHDGTLNLLMYSLGIGNHLLIPYTATLIAELHLEDEHYFVKFLYKNETNNVYTLQFPNCSELCPLDTFLGRVADSRVGDLRQMKEMCNFSANSVLLATLYALVFVLFE